MKANRHFGGGHVSRIDVQLVVGVNCFVTEHEWGAKAGRPEAARGACAGQEIGGMAAESTVGGG